MELRDALRAVVDPEVNVNIVDLGLVYDVHVKDKKASVRMTMTTPMCPAGGLIMSEVERVIREQGFEPSVELTFNPPWTPDMMSPEARRKLNL